ncbi:MAG: secretin N-terminal domain-containing protein [Planctomycetota bacterium]
MPRSTRTVGALAPAFNAVSHALAAAFVAASLLGSSTAAAASAPQGSARPAGTAPQGAPSGANQDEDTPPPIQVVGETYVLNFAQGNASDSMTLLQFVDACEQVTQLNFTWNTETEQFLSNAKLRLLGPKEVPKDRFYSFFQVMMIINDFVCTEIGDKDISIIQIDSLQTSRRNTIRSQSLYVAPEDLEKYADQPATLITTVIDLPNTDVRQVSNSMRTMITDANTQQMLPAGNSTTMVLTGFGSTTVALARMLKIIDEASKVTPIVPVFERIPLEFAVADDVASIVEELLNAASRVARNSGGNPAQGVSAPLQQGQGEAKIMVDTRANALLVMAMPTDMPRIRELVAELDVDVPLRERTYHIYSLENVAAETLAETLNDFLQDAARLEQQRAGGQGQAQARNTTSNSQEFVVVADVETNSLLIAASRTRYEELLGLIQRLDKRQDQVLIETALVELTGSNFLDIGVELGFADVPGASETGGFGVTSFGLSTLSDSDGDGTPDLRVPNTAQGVTAGIIDGDNFSLPFLLALLERRNNSNVLNVPSVLVNNNSSATVTTLDEQPTTTITATGGVSGQTQENFAGYQEAGITMTISPSISASRYLRLSISLQVSTFIGAVQGAIPPPRTTRTIDTQINVPDGDTMVIGGIVIDNRSSTRTQVPFLGDLPIIRHLFSRDSDTSNKTALYFFVTPHILKESDFADLAEISYRKKLEAAQDIGHDRIKIIDPSFGKERSGVDLSGFDLPLYAPPERGEVNGPEVGIGAKEAAEKLGSERGN